MSDNPSSQRSRSKTFTKVFVERNALKHGKTESLLDSLDEPEPIIIENYKELFNRKNQSFTHQKSLKRLILAVKNPPFTYPFSEFIQNYGQKSYYVSLAKNCVYDCSYCYLQQNDGGDFVFYVNGGDMLEEAAKLPHGSRISISYDSDILAVDGIFDIVDSWIAFAKKHSDKTVELRSKSVNIDTFLNKEIPHNFELSFTLLPKTVQKQYEKHTPSLNKRIGAIKKLQAQNVSLMLCIDPIIVKDASLDDYTALVEALQKELKDANLSFSIGVFRMNSDVLKKIRKKGIQSDLLYFPYDRIDDEDSYPETIRNHALSLMETKIKECFANAKIYKPCFKKGA